MGQERPKPRESRDKISIPLWFDYGPFDSVVPIHSQDFNSTMVRLWGISAAYRKTACIFQFHYGSIMGSSPEQYQNAQKISIPLWFDYGKQQQQQTE